MRTYFGDPGGDAGWNHVSGGCVLGACGDSRANVAHLGGGVELVQDDPGVVAADARLRLLVQLEPTHLASAAEGLFIAGRAGGCERRV